MHTNYQLFVYGTLRQGFHHPAYQYISQSFNIVGPAKVQGRLYDLGEFPAALPSTSEEAFIYGELYAIKNTNEFDFAIAQLDDYEGISPEESEDTALFRRELAKVYLAGGETEAWIYWYNRAGAAEHPVVASGDVLEYFKNK